MAIGEINRINPYYKMSQVFGQAPSTSTAGVLAKALAGFTGGLGMAKESQIEKQKSDALSSALAGFTPQSNYVQPDMTPGALLEKGYVPQKTISELSRTNPSLAIQLATSNLQRTRQLQDEASRREFESGLLSKKLEQKKAQELAKQQKPSEFTKTMQKETAKAVNDARIGYSRVLKTHAEVMPKIQMVKDALPLAMSGNWVGIQQEIARTGLEKTAKKFGIDVGDLVATRDIEANLKSMVGAILKATFGGVVSEGEREFLREAMAKETMTKEEIMRSMEIIEKWQENAIKGAEVELNTILDSAKQFSGEVNLSDFAPRKTQTKTMVSQSKPTTKISSFEDLGI